MDRRAAMLTELTIRDLAIIEALRLDLGPGLTVLTGETGAGKSIILGALHLLLGDRASTDDLRAGADEAEVCARFAVKGLRAVRDLLAAEDLADPEDPDALLIRRVILREGRSKCWVNGRPVPVGSLRALGDRLVDLHGQHQHQSLLDPELHREALDDFGGHGAELGAVRAAHRAWSETRDARRRLEGDARELERRRDFLLHQVNEIEAANLRDGELAEREAERKRLRHAEELLRAMALGVDRLVEGEREGENFNALALIGEVRHALEDVAEHDETLAALLEPLISAESTLMDVAETLRDHRDRMDLDPGRLDEIEERIVAIRQILRRHGDSEAEVLRLCEEWRAEAEAIGNRDAELERLRQEEAKTAKALAKAALALRASREASAANLSRALVKELRAVAMDKVGFEVRMDATLDENGIEVDGHGRVRVDETGMDAIEFLIAPNPGEPLKPLAKIASGGELSRVMLALKAVAAGRDRVPTLMFDEIDVGISGATATRVAEKMSALSQRHQILCITHLPQIAAAADTHLGVAKRTKGKRTITEVAVLEGETRVDALATLISGERTATARRHAAEMLG